MALHDRVFGAFRSRKYRWLLLGVVIVAGLIRLWISTQPIDVLLEKNLPDDSYYYFVIARNTVRANSVSMDGVNVTNGFHPLWLFVLMPLFGRAAALSDSLVTQTLILSSILDMVTIWIVGQLAAILTRRESLGVLGAGLYAFNPIVILQVTNGLETALAMLTISVFLLLLWAWLSKPPGWTLTVFLGISGALMFLARSDSIFLLGLSYIAALIYWRCEKKRWLAVIVAGITSSVIVLPWFLWSYFSVGSWMQESGVAVPYAIRVRVAINEGSGIIIGLKEAIRRLAFATNWLRGDYTGLPFFLGILLWFIVIIGLVRRWRIASSVLEKTILLPLLGSALLLVLVHAGIRWYPRPWYFIPSSLAFSLGYSLIIKSSLSQEIRRIFLSILCFGLYFALTGYVFWQFGYYPWQREMLQASRWLGDNLPSDSRVASFNSGIYAYYNDFPVINLDGVVNPQAFKAVQDRNIIEYLQREHIGYLVDYDNAIKNEYAPFMGEGYPEKLVEIEVINEEPTSELGSIRVYRVLE